MLAINLGNTAIGGKVLMACRQSVRASLIGEARPTTVSL
jgi:hypothetical protein